TATRPPSRSACSGGASTSDVSGQVSAPSLARWLNGIRLHPSRGRIAPDSHRPGRATRLSRPATTASSTARHGPPWRSTSARRQEQEKSTFPLGKHEGRRSVSLKPTENKQELPCQAIA